MNRTTWGLLREYIAAEMKLALARQDRNRSDAGRHHSQPRNTAWDARIAELEAQSTRMETAIREALPESESYCACPGPWCEGRDRDTKVRCLGYQIDSDGMAGVGACVTCGTPAGAVESLVAVCDDLNARVSALERKP